jgi:hypothetical protein
MCPNWPVGWSYSTELEEGITMAYQDFLNSESERKDNSRNKLLVIGYVQGKIAEWLTFDEDTKAELLAIVIEKGWKIVFKNVSFGTGGLRNCEAERPYEQLYSEKLLWL